jgi:ATP-dependent exoDNAse (exonuclease V) alpha subunit
MTREQVNLLNMACVLFYNNRTETRARVFHIGDKIMCISNSRIEGVAVSNGEIMRLEAINRYETSSAEKGSQVMTTENAPSKGYFALEFSCPDMTGDSDPKHWERKIITTDKIPLSSFVLGYATTCHKFQGSETDTIIFYSPPTSRKHAFRTSTSPSALYTGITRAKKQVIIISTPEEISSTMKQRDDIRRSSLVGQIRTLINLDDGSPFSKPIFKRFKNSMFRFM